MGASRDHRAFEILAREHHRALLAYAAGLSRRTDVAEDLVQEAFVVAWRRLPDFDPSRDFAAWMRGIVRMKHLEWSRARRETPADPALLEGLDRRHASWSRPGHDLFDALDRCLQSLPVEFRAVVDLFYRAGKSGPEIARGSGETEESVRKRLQRARGMLGACVQGRMEESP